MGRTFGRVSPRSKNLAFLPWGSSLLGGRVALPEWSLVKTPHLDLKQGDAFGLWTNGAGGGASPQSTKKSSEKYL